MNTWNLVYDYIDPVAFRVFGFNFHWYGVMYATALIMGVALSKYFARVMPRFAGISNGIIDSYFIWAEIGIIIGARFGYLLVYSDMGLYYLLHPWNAFNPYVDGQFVGIAGMSYHGAVFGLLVSSLIFAYFKRNVDMFNLLDLLAMSLPLPYILGRVGNFLNKELYGRVIRLDELSFLGIYVDGFLRYPSQLVEAFLEGLVLFFIVYIVSVKTEVKGLLLASYIIGYGVMRFIAEYTREADAQMGYYFMNLSMGQILSVVMALAGLVLLYYLVIRSKRHC